MTTLGRRELLESTLAMVGLSTAAFAQGGQGLDVVVAKPGESRFDTGGPIVFKLSSTDTRGRYSIIESGALNPPMHRHLHQDEWFYVVQGEFGFQVGDQRMRLSAGGSVLGPRGIPHGFVGLGDAPRKLLIMYEPAGMMEPFFKELSALLVNNQFPSPERMAALNVKYGMESVGPPLTADAFK